jgi:CDP-paratose 2-epimerase
VEDQGWLAWFIIAVIKGHPITIFGDGKQVRDVLFIEDLLECYEKIIKNISISAGQIYNIGGGPENSISIWKELRPILEELIKHPIDVELSNWRPGDQHVYISDIRKAKRELDWSPQTTIKNGIEKFFNWAVENQNLFSS